MEIMVGEKKITNIGPFGAARENVEVFANNMYFNHLYMQTWEKFLETQKEYDAAVLLGDQDTIQQISRELRFMEEVIKLSSINYDKHEADSTTLND